MNTIKGGTPSIILRLAPDTTYILLMKHYLRPYSCAIVDALSFKLICLYLDYYDKVSTFSSSPS